MSNIRDVLLTKKNKFEYAAYIRSGYVFQEELQRDYNLVIMIKRLMFKYYRSRDLKSDLIINYLKTFYNLFGDKGTSILFLEIDEELYCILKTFLVYLNKMPEIVEFNGCQVFSDSLEENEDIKATLYGRSRKHLHNI